MFYIEIKIANKLSYVPVLSFFSSSNFDRLSYYQELGVACALDKILLAIFWQFLGTLGFKSIYSVKLLHETRPRQFARVVSLILAENQTKLIKWEQRLTFCSKSWVAPSNWDLKVAAAEKEEWGKKPNRARLAFLWLLRFLVVPFWLHLLLLLMNWAK